MEDIIRDAFKAGYRAAHAELEFVYIDGDEKEWWETYIELPENFEQMKQRAKDLVK